MTLAPTDTAPRHETRNVRTLHPTGPREQRTAPRHRARRPRRAPRPDGHRTPSTAEQTKDRLRDGAAAPASGLARDIASDAPPAGANGTGAGEPIHEDGQFPAAGPWSIGLARDTGLGLLTGPGGARPDRPDAHRLPAEIRQPADRPTPRHSRRWSDADVWIRLATIAAVLTVAAIAAAVSYRHMRGVALDHGEDATAAAIIPISVDGLIVAASMTLLADSRAGRRRTWLSYTLLVLSSAASIAANVMHAQPDLAARLISAWPSAALIGTYELLMGQIRATTRPRARDGASTSARRDTPRLSNASQSSPGSGADANLATNSRRSAPTNEWPHVPTSQQTSTHRPEPSTLEEPARGRAEEGPEPKPIALGAWHRTADPSSTTTERHPAGSADTTTLSEAPPADQGDMAASAARGPSASGTTGTKPSETPASPTHTTAPLTIKPGTKRADLAALLATIAPDDPRTDYALAQHLGPAVNLHISTARRYIVELRSTRRPAAAA